MSVYGLNKDYPTYQYSGVRRFAIMVESGFNPISNATYIVDVPMSNAAGFYRVANLITNQ